MTTQVQEKPVDVAVEKAAEPEVAPRPQVRKWDPFDLVNQMQTELDRFWGDRRFPFRALPKFGAFDESWVPRTDVFEQDGNLVVKAELPGMKKEDIHVDVEHGELVIRGERKTEEKVEEKDYYRSERTFGSFYRRLPMPEGVTVDDVKASYKDGVLEVVLPKPVAKPVEAKKVEIK